MIQAEAQHRDYAIVEQAFADLTERPAGAPATHSLNNQCEHEGSRCRRRSR